MKLLISIVMTLSLTTQAIASCEEKLVQCEQIMNLGKEIITDQQAELHRQLDTLLKLDKENQDLITQNEKLLEQDGKWYRNPFIIGVLGFALGVVTIEVAK